MVLDFYLVLLRKPFPFLFSFLEHYLQILKHDTIAVLDQIIFETV